MLTSSYSRSLWTSWHGMARSKCLPHTGDIWQRNHIRRPQLLCGRFRCGHREQIDYGSAQWPTSRTYTGHEPPAEECSNTMWADSEGELTNEQRNRLRQEFSSLISRSIAYTMASANLIGKADAAANTAAFAIAGDPSCHPSSL